MEQLMMCYVFYVQLVIHALFFIAKLSPSTDSSLAD